MTEDQKIRIKALVKKVMLMDEQIFKEREESAKLFNNMKVELMDERDKFKDAMYEAVNVKDEIILEKEKLEHSLECYKTDLKTAIQDCHDMGEKLATAEKELSWQGNHDHYRERIAELTELLDGERVDKEMEKGVRVACQERLAGLENITKTLVKSHTEADMARTVLETEVKWLKERFCAKCFKSNPHLKCSEVCGFPKPSGDGKTQEGKYGTIYGLRPTDIKIRSSDDGKLGANSTQGEPAAVASSKSSASSEVTSLNTHPKSSEDNSSCPECGGSGYNPFPYNCTECGGSGKAGTYCTCESSPPGVLLKDGTCGGCGGMVNQPESLHNVCRHCGGVIMKDVMICNRCGTYNPGK